jgi:DNA adenine methylase
MDTQKKRCNIIKPILKWVGGKTQIIDKLMENFPKEMNNYHEVFLGGGSVLLAILGYMKEDLIKINGTIYVYDKNEVLIYVYKNIQSSPNELYDSLQKLISEFNSCNGVEIVRNPKTFEEAKTSKESFYYWVRNEYNKLSSEDKKTISGSTMFIFLNKTCFRGLYRVGPNGFNVPYGHYKNPEIINRVHLLQIHDLIKQVVFESCDFTASLQNVTEGDYVYLDPPYAPQKETSFVGYTEGGFTIEQHNKLFDSIHNLTKKTIRVMMSNADVELVRQQFPIEKYQTQSILCKRSIHSKNPQTKAKEVIIKNY